MLFRSASNLWRTLPRRCCCAPSRKRSPLIRRRCGGKGRPGARLPRLPALRLRRRSLLSSLRRHWRLTPLPPQQPAMVAGRGQTVWPPVPPPSSTFTSSMAIQPPPPTENIPPTADHCARPGFFAPRGRRTLFRRCPTLLSSRRRRPVGPPQLLRTCRPRSLWRRAWWQRRGQPRRRLCVRIRKLYHSAPAKIPV